ncbi:DUF5615 family PIN-like protein [Microbulbifer sp. TRSA002]|uniref:DUF5615 family PIN-like protein n=1 Tax=Microbulbifer sp. TRSA002 TaxID=3243382 RepID=UPI0040398B2F
MKAFLHGLKGLLQKKPKYFVDENMGHGITEIIRSWKESAKDVWDAGLDGQPDENIWQYCVKKKKIILTHDDDFLNHRKYPLTSCYGVVVFPKAEGGELSLVGYLRHFIGFMSAGAGSIWQTKLVVRENSHWEFTTISELGNPEKTIYDVTNTNSTYMLNK